LQRLDFELNVAGRIFSARAYLDTGEPSDSSNNHFGAEIAARTTRPTLLLVHSFNNLYLVVTDITERELVVGVAYSARSWDVCSTTVMSFTLSATYNPSIT
jgi:hypothetical protein